MDEEVFLLLCMEGSFVLLPTCDMAMVVDIRDIHPLSRMKLVCNMVTIVAV